jgi:hypothetical protein
LPWADRIREADAMAVEVLTPEVIADIVALVPDEWLGHADTFVSPAAHRSAFVTYFTHRLQAPRAFAEEAIRAHDQLV